jgi:hypothetical protein
MRTILAAALTISVRDILVAALIIAGFVAVVWVIVGEFNRRR